MNTSQLKCIIQCDPVLERRVIGVFAADRLPSALPQTPFGFIVNTDIHSKPGVHWCAFFSDASGRFEFFDSYGRPPGINSHYFKRWIEIKAKTVHTNHIQIQSDNSTLCGLYSILFLRQRLAGYTFQQFLNRFDAVSLYSNDYYVADMMVKAYPQCIGDECDNNQTCMSLIKCF